MTTQTFIDRFIDATDFQTPVTITLDSELRSLPEWDSLAALAVIVMFDIEYQTTISGDDLHQAVTVGDLYRRAQDHPCRDHSWVGEQRRSCFCRGVHQFAGLHEPLDD